MIKFEDKRQLILDGFDAYGVRHRLRAGHFHPSTGVSKSLLGCHMDFFGDLKMGGLKTAKDRVSKVVGVCLNMADNAISVILQVFFSKLN